MMGQYKSMIKAITDAIQTGVGGNIHLNERSFLSHLLESRWGESFFTETKKECEQSKKHETFVITRWLIRLISKLLTCLLWLFNVVCYPFVLLFWGSNPQNFHINIKNFDIKSIKSFLKKSIKSLLNIECSPIINLAAVVIVLVLGIVFIVNMITVGVKDIMFAPVNMRVNSQGVITLDQPCLESHSFFLMNASTFWWPTDIPVSKEDSVIISVSGSMYSDIGEVYLAATSNRHMRYSRRFFAKKNKNESLFDSIGTSICIKPDACFGALLCQISNEYQAPTRTSEAQIEKIGFEHNRFDVKQPGVLYITFNDVFLSDEIVDKLRHSADSSTVVMKEDLENTDYFKNLDSGQLKAGHEEIWFNDNVGEYLVNIRVKKNIRHGNILWYKKPIFIIYRRIEGIERGIERGIRGDIRGGIENTKVYWIVGAILFYIFLDVLVSYLLKRRRKILSSVKQDCIKCHTKTSENASE